MISTQSSTEKIKVSWVENISRLRAQHVQSHRGEGQESLTMGGRQNTGPQVKRDAAKTRQGRHAEPGTQWGSVVSAHTDAVWVCTHCHFMACRPTGL